jgi:hypothetical protein
MDSAPGTQPTPPPSPSRTHSPREWTAAAEKLSSARLTNLNQNATAAEALLTTSAAHSHPPQLVKQMHSDYPPCETIRQRLERDLRAITELLRPGVILSNDNLVLEDYGAGHAWLRPEPPDGGPIDADTPIPYVLTDRGRRVIGRPRVSTCFACGRPQSSPSCATREHWGRVTHQPSATPLSRI